MKRGVMTLEIMVMIIIALFFTGIVAYGVVEKIPRKGTIIERFLPEKCKATGLTRDDYLGDIRDLLGRGRVIEASKKYTEMKTCFRDAEIPEVQRRYVASTVAADVIALGKNPTPASYAQLLTLYQDTKNLLGNNIQDLGTESLLYFVRAIWHAPKDVRNNLREDALNLLNIIEEKESYKRTLVAAEALTLAGQFLQESDDTEAQRTFNTVIKNFGNQKEPEYQYAVGIAYGGVGATDKALLSLQEAQKSSDAYVKHGAQAIIVSAHLAANKIEAAAQALESALPSVDFKQSVHYPPALQQYASIPPEQRKIKNCASEASTRTDCLCTSANNQLLPALTAEKTIATYCCNGFVSRLPCYLNDCKTPNNCADYQTPEDCEKDVCAIIPKFFPQVHAVGGYCKWDYGQKTMDGKSWVYPPGCGPRAI